VISKVRYGMNFLIVPLVARYVEVTYGLTLYGLGRVQNEKYGIKQ
jgi:hypothetical protein